MGSCLPVAGRGAAQLITQGRIVTFVEPHLVAIGGATVFGERLSNTQLAGVGLGVIAMGLMLLPAAERS